MEVQFPVNVLIMDVSTALLQDRVQQLVMELIFTSCCRRMWWMRSRRSDWLLIFFGWRGPVLWCSSRNGPSCLLKLAGGGLGLCGASDCRNCGFSAVAVHRRSSTSSSFRRGRSPRSRLFSRPQSFPSCRSFLGVDATVVQVVQVHFPVVAQWQFPWSRLFVGPFTSTVAVHDGRCPCCVRRSRRFISPCGAVGSSHGPDCSSDLLLPQLLYTVADVPVV